VTAETGTPEGDDSSVDRAGGIDDTVNRGDSDGDGGSSTATSDTGSSGVDTAGGSTEPIDSGADDGFGRQGWVLVAGIVACFLFVPGLIYLRPATPAAAGLPFFATFLVLPLVPAIILGLLAVWSMRAAA
jgi:hypothetical protein